MPLVQRGRQALLGTLAAAALAASTLVAGVWFARVTPTITTISDIAVIELYTDLASKGRLLVGPYSRFGWHHPGPLYFYLQAPLYLLAGHQAAALYAGALAINLGSLILLVYVTARENRGCLLVLVTAAAVVFAWRTPRFLASPWTAHVPVLPTLSFVVLCAATGSRSPYLLPLALAMGSFVVQTHLEFVPVVSALAAATIATLVTSRQQLNRSKPLAIASVVVCLLLWLIPIAEAVSHAGGNLVALWRFFVAGGGQAHTLREAVLAWSYGLAGVFRADFTLPWGGHFAPGNSWRTLACSVGGVLLLPVIAGVDIRAGRRFAGNLALAAFIACVTGLWALTRVRGDILDHEIFWLAAVGLLNAAVISAAALRGIGERLSTWKANERVAIMLALLSALAGIGVGVRDLRHSAAYELSRLDRPRIIAAHSSIRDYVHDRDIRKPLIDIDAMVWSQAAGVLVKLQRDGMAFALTPDARPMFTDAFAATGAEDAQISIASQTLHRQLMSRSDNKVLLEADPVYIDAVRARP